MSKNPIEEKDFNAKLGLGVPQGSRGEVFMSWEGQVLVCLGECGVERVKAAKLELGVPQGRGQKGYVWKGPGPGPEFSDKIETTRY